MIVFKPKKQCSMCKQYFDEEELFLCDGIVGYRRHIPFEAFKPATCDRLICKNCKKSVGGYDFCDKCYQNRGKGENK